jgi:hypothetical protein
MAFVPMEMMRLEAATNRSKAHAAAMQAQFEMAQHDYTLACLTPGAAPESSPIVVQKPSYWPIFWAVCVLAFILAAAVGGGSTHYIP